MVLSICNCAAAAGTEGTAGTHPRYQTNKAKTIRMCSSCAAWFSFSVRGTVFGADVRFNLFGGILSLLLVVSVFFLLVLLNRLYVKSLRGDYEVSRRLLLAISRGRRGDRRAAERKRASGKKSGLGRDERAALLQQEGTDSSEGGGEYVVNDEGDEERRAFSSSALRSPVVHGNSRKDSRDEKRTAVANNNNSGGDGLLEPSRAARMEAGRVEEEELDFSAIAGTFVLPEYYTFTLWAMLWFALQAVVDFVAISAPADAPPLFFYLRYLVHSGCAFLDAWVFFFLLMPQASPKSFRRALMISLGIAVVYLIQAFALPLPRECSYCGVHIPNSWVFTLYIPAGFFYAAPAVVWFFFRRFRSRMRPALVLWGSFLAPAYFLVGLSVFLLKFFKAEISYCILLAVLVWYTVLYAAVFYRVATTDSLFCLREGLVKDTDTSQSSRMVDSVVPSTIPLEFRDLLRDGTLNVIALEDLEMLERVGAGGFGEVWRARWMHSDVAVKRIFAFGMAEVRFCARISAPRPRSDLLCIFLPFSIGRRSVL
jgi:hypothetical protein